MGQGNGGSYHIQSAVIQTAFEPGHVPKINWLWPAL